MSLTGTTGKEDYGFTVEVRALNRNLLLNQRVARIDLLSNELSKDFLLYFLLSRKFLDQLYPTAKGMKQANLSTHAMKRLKIVVPSAGEQTEIGRVCRLVDRKLKVHQVKRNALAELLSTLLHQLMTSQLRVAELEILT